MTSLKRMRFPTLFASAAALAAVTPAAAEDIQIPAPAFVRQCPCGTESNPAVETAGTITPVQGRSSYFAALPYAGRGSVCSMSMVYRDANQNEALTVSLFRKKIEVGAQIDAAPILVARVVSASGVSDAVRKTDAKRINNPAVNTSNSFYYLQADFDNINMDLVGVQVDIRNTCPS